MESKESRNAFRVAEVVGCRIRSALRRAARTLHTGGSAVYFVRSKVYILSLLFQEGFGSDVL